jgi:hypothetical protein
MCYSVEELRDLQNNPEKLMKLIFDADLVSLVVVEYEA